MGRIDFGSNQPWAAVNQVEYQRMAKDHRHPLAYRTHFAALGWANRIGHAEFSEGSLGVILGDEEGNPLVGSSVSNAIARAKRFGLVAPSSNARCLVLSRHHFQKEGRGTGFCRAHGLRVAGEVRTSRVA